MIYEKTGFGLNRALSGGVSLLSCLIGMRGVLLEECVVYAVHDQPLSCREPAATASVVGHEVFWIWFACFVSTSGTVAV